jgi:CubicO group peptidase (beta-lactamase class C family)
MRRGLLLMTLAFAPTVGAQAALPKSNISSACEPYRAKIESYRKFIIAWLDRDKVPGATVGFTKGRCFWVEGFGEADVENAIPATPRTAYRYASIQKSMTATAALQLAEAGKLDLDAPIQAYVPYFPAKPYKITARELLGHLGGIAHYPDPERTKDLTRHLSSRETIGLFAQYDLVAEPGTKFNYSTFGYDLLGAAIEGASGQPYADYMTQHVWGPAGMSSTTMDDPAAIIPHRSSGYVRENGQLRNAPFVDVSNRFAGGGTIGTVGDMLRFMKALNDGKLLDRKSLTLMYTPMKTRDGALSGFPHTAGYAMGWNIQHREGSWFAHNDGGQPGTSTFILNYPEKDFTFAMAQNIQEGGGTDVVFKLYELILGKRFVLL